MNKLISVAAVACAACAPVSGPLYISKFYPMGDGCVVAKPGDLLLYKGFIDVAPGNAQYWVNIEIKGANTVATEPLVVGNTVLEPEDRTFPVLDKLVLNYSSSKLTGFRESQQPVSLPFNAGVAFGGFNIISREAAAVLDKVVASNDAAAVVPLEVRAEFRGHMSGNNSYISTGVFTFPMDVRRTELLPVVGYTGAPACTTSFRSVTPGKYCVYPGTQHPSAFVCCPAPPAGVEGCP